ncbi:N-(5'-phosphoribosyl)anthranilate isomerase [Nakaseomyces bracarensis]|uniref:N-(5'-phosphoribosyl)anthranilate isomerase n=1 Tax=Nakaseomyces bracarensis TaxID=273131 RepID=A0ABR4NSH4_9SACH
MSFNEFLKNHDSQLVKVCGLQSLEAAETAVSSGADLIGIICVPNRARTIQPDIARSISELVHDPARNPHGTKLVGVFRNQSIIDVSIISRDYGVDIVQLHGDETWEEYHEKLGKPIIKRAVFPRDCALVEELSHQDAYRCLPLFDSDAGGTGEKLNWGAIGDWATATPHARFILAGGLTPDNVRDALSVPGTMGVDVSGGVETHGAKDLEKIKQFISNAKN